MPLRKPEVDNDAVRYAVVALGHERHLPETDNSCTTGTSAEPLTSEADVDFAASSHE
jgi:hypothetical protein